LKAVIKNFSSYFRYRQNKLILESCDDLVCSKMDKLTPKFSILEWLKEEKIVASFLLYIFFLLHTTCSHTVHEYYFLKLCWRRPKKKRRWWWQKKIKKMKKKEYWKFIQNNPSSEWTDKTLENYAAALKMPKKKLLCVYFLSPFSTLLQCTVYSLPPSSSKNRL